jgi:hypothetical protein
MGIIAGIVLKLGESKRDGKAVIEGYRWSWLRENEERGNMKGCKLAQDMVNCPSLCHMKIPADLLS